MWGGSLLSGFTNATKKLTLFSGGGSLLSELYGINIDFDQETGQEYSTMVLIIVKADRGKAIA